ncbi:MAG: hypothetical protein KKC84_04220 [Candidatus Omnitrophica bacterium]|nr:hypothetical protein [Candidatus Omnitrophota bacterium]
MDDAANNIQNIVLDENPNVKSNDRLPIQAPIKVLRYKTIKKNSSLGWWSAIVLVEDHDKKMVCFYRWRKKGNEWKRDKKLPFHSRAEWHAVKDAVESFMDQVA